MKKYILFLLLISISLFSCDDLKKNKKKSTPNLECSEKISYCESIVSDTNIITLDGYSIFNESFKLILKQSMDEYENCENREKGYHFSIQIRNAKLKVSPKGNKLLIEIGSEVYTDSIGAKSLYISRSYYKGFVSRGYGYFYLDTNLFILEGLQEGAIFRKTNKVQTFIYKKEPIVVFDPPRWLFCYWKNKFYFSYKSPCGG